MTSLTKIPVLRYVGMLGNGPHAYASYSDFAAAIGTVLSAPLPTVRLSSGRGIVPLSTGVPILPGQSAQITGRFQTEAKAGRLVISNAGTNQGAADWFVNTLKINDRSQLAQPGVEGGRFSVSCPDDGACFELAQPVLDVVVTVTYRGLWEEGCPFFGGLIGI